MKRGGRWMAVNGCICCAVEASEGRKWSEKEREKGEVTRLGFVCVMAYLYTRSAHIPLRRKSSVATNDSLECHVVGDRCLCVLQLSNKLDHAGEEELIKQLRAVLAVFHFPRSQFVDWRCSGLRTV